MKLFGDAYRGRRVLVTGHTGFKGSWLMLWLRELGAHVAGFALEPAATPSHWESLRLDGVADYRADLRDTTAVKRVLEEHQPEMVFHLAAQALVRRSYREPAETFACNVIGLINLFEAVRTCASVRVLVNATTDKVYAEHPQTQGYCEPDPLGAGDPYSTSKACAELVSDCYRKSFFNDGATRIATARAGNVFGGGDWAEDRLVPDVARAALMGKPLLIRNPTFVRPWQHVLEPLSGYLVLGQMLLADRCAAGAWNFGPGKDGEISVHSLVSQLGRHWPELRPEYDQATQPYESAMLRLDANKARRDLGWRPVWPLETALARTTSWYQRFGQSGRVTTLDDLRAYVRDAQRLGVDWSK